MALRTIMLRHKLEAAENRLQELRDKDSEFETREAELETAIGEATTEEESKTLDADIEAFEQERSAHREAVTRAEQEIEQIRADLAAEEAKEPKPAEAQPAAGANNERSENTPMNTRQQFFGMTTEQRDAFIGREDVKTFLTRVRELKGQNRSISGGELTIPEVFLGLIRENVPKYSKLLKYVNLRHVPGKARQTVPGAVPEAVWTEMCAKLNELDLDFNNVELDGYKVGGYVPVCNGLLEDSDIALATELIDMIAKAIAKALDKAIPYGKGKKMPLGIITRLCQTAQPDDYPDNARPWQDLHTSNIKKVTGTGVDLFKNIIKAAPAAKNNYASGSRFWVMNETTHMNLVAEALAFNANGALVAGMNNTMPVIGGDIVELEFFPDGVILTGYGDLYTLGERSGAKFGVSEYARFVEDQTVFKGTARYDGKPAVAEAFAVLYTGSTAPKAEDVTFAADTANTANTASAGGEG